MNKSELMALDLRSALLAYDCHSLFPDEYRNYAGLCVERLRGRPRRSGRGRIALPRSGIGFKMLTGYN